MNLTAFAVRHRSIIWAFVLLLSLSGVSTFLTMSRRENPEMKIRTCVVSVIWPGATAQKVEDLVTDPLETAISKIDEVEEIRSESRTGLSLIYIDMDERLNNVDQLWDEVRNKVNQAAPGLPSGCRTPYVNADFGDVYDVVLALSQTAMPGHEGIERPYSYRELELFSETIEDELKAISLVAKVDTLGIQDEVIDVEIDTGEWAKIAITVDRLRSLLESRNITASGGEVNTSDSRFSVTPSGEFTSVDQIGSTIVDLTDG